MNPSNNRLQQPLKPEERIIVALDVPDSTHAMTLVETLSPLGVRFKVGMQLYYNSESKIVQDIQDIGGTVFTDLKLHDIPTTVGKAAQSLVYKGSDFFNVHCTGGKTMMQMARTMADEAALSLGKSKPIIIGVTVLTSMDEATLKNELSVSKNTTEQVVHLAQLAKASGLDGVVCSAQEAEPIRRTCGNDFLLVTPGIRPSGSDTQDQNRILTPAQALQKGSDYLVIGRPITEAKNPVSATAAIIEELKTACEAVTIQ